MEQGRGSNSNMSSGGSNESIIYGITLQKRCACCSASNNNSHQKHTAHANSHHKIVHGGYFTLPLFIAIVYVFRTNSYLCAGRVLHSPPAAHSSLTTTTSNQTAMHQRLVGRSIFADIHISCTKTAFTTRPAMASKANISNMTLLT